MVNANTGSGDNQIMSRVHTLTVLNKYTRTSLYNIFFCKRRQLWKYHYTILGHDDILTLSILSSCRIKGQPFIHLPIDKTGYKRGSTTHSSRYKIYRQPFGLPLEVAFAAVFRGATPPGLLQRWTRTPSSLRRTNYLPMTLHLTNATRLAADIPVAPLAHSTVTRRSSLPVPVLVLRWTDTLLDSCTFVTLWYATQKGCIVVLKHSPLALRVYAEEQGNRECYLFISKVSRWQIHLLVLSLPKYYLLCLQSCQKFGSPPVFFAGQLWHGYHLLLSLLLNVCRQFIIHVHLVWFPAQIRLRWGHPRVFFPSTELRTQFVLLQLGRVGPQRMKRGK